MANKIGFARMVEGWPGAKSLLILLVGAEAKTKGCFLLSCEGSGGEGALAALWRVR